MSAWQTALTEYVALRRALGFNLQDVGRWLDQCVRFADTEGAGCITPELTLRWALQSAQASAAHRARRLGIVRPFAP
jgi:integrase/recombinase XerD